MVVTPPPPPPAAWISPPDRIPSPPPCPEDHDLWKDRGYNYCPMCGKRLRYDPVDEIIYVNDSTE